jgi:hypothetical protein
LIHNGINLTFGHANKLVDHVKNIIGIINLAIASLLLKLRRKNKYLPDFITVAFVNNGWRYYRGKII